MADIKISDMTNGSVIAGSLFETAQPAGDDYLTTKVSAADIGSYVGATQTFTFSDGGSRTLVNQINRKAEYTEVTGTLAVGSTSITLSDESILTTSTIDVYTDGDVDYDSISVATGSVTLTFEAQETALGVKVRVS